MFRDTIRLLSVFLLIGTGCSKSNQDIKGDAETRARNTFLVAKQQVDILFMVDNSPSMDPKQTALVQSFSKMLRLLQEAPGGLPDLHIGVVSSDVGCGGNELGSCGFPLGNRGLLWGNDNTDAALNGVSAIYNQFATVAKIANGCGLSRGARWIEDTQATNGQGRVRNYTGELTEVFSCLGMAVGTKGSGEEHQLQSIRIALNPQSNINDANRGFLRPQAKLAIVMVSDEDDCSADPYPGTDRIPNNDNLFTARGYPSETTSLRCAGRGHVCNGQAIANYDPTTGYDGSQGPLSVNFADCAAKEPTNPPDYHWLPLIPVQTFIDDVVGAKNGHSEDIFVSGIIGWPQNGDLTGVQYRIDKDPTAVPASLQTLWDYMPICSLPSVSSSDGNVYKAYGGLRLKRFIDGFGDNGKTFSLCNNDFSEPMEQIGRAIAQRWSLGCVDQPLLDTDPSAAGVQPDCLATMRAACAAPGAGGCLSAGYVETPLSQCKDPAGGPVDPDSFQSDRVPDTGRPCWYLDRANSLDGCANSSQRIRVLLNAGSTDPSNISLLMQCL